MKKTTLIFLFFLFLTACEQNRFVGKIDSKSELIIRGGRKDYKVAQGEHPISLTFSKRQIELILNYSDKKIKIPLKSSIEIPNGDFHLGAEQINQDFDVDGSINLVFEKSEEGTKIARCQVLLGQHYVCRQVYEPKNCQRINDREVCTGGVIEQCSWEDYYANGYKRQTFYTTYSYNLLNLNLKEKNTSNIIASLTGQTRTESTEVIINETECQMTY